ncbi:MAG: DUF2007 domain-containing protein [Gammaproteobacteria bacterium]|nr:DUF2007 domain-containing protein [Gammaproteobacteria bacterium]
MRKVFSSNEPIETVLVRDALLHGGIDVTIQNEYSGRSAIPGFRPPAEIWVDRDDDYERARRLVVATLAILDSAAESPSWVCSYCRQSNPPAFEICWNCGRDRVDSSARDPNR